MIKRNLLVMGLAVLLSACGFQLRGTGSTELTLKELDLSARDAYGDTLVQLRSVLENSGVKVYTGAPYKLVLTNEQESSRNLSYASAGRPADVELTSELSYTIYGPGPLELLSDKLQAQKVISRDPNNLVGSDSEAIQIRKEVRRDLVQRMVMRLQMLSPAQLDALQQTAEARARAEADALKAAQDAEANTPRQSPAE